MTDSPLRSVAVASVAYNSSSQLEPFLASLAEAEPGGLLVVIADNASTDVDRSRSIARAHGAKLLELGENRGYGGAINSVVASLPAEIRYVVVSNPDVVVTPGAISTLVDAMQRWHAGAVGPRVVNEDGSVYPSARRLPSLRTGVGHAVFGLIWPSNPWTRSYREEAASLTVERPVGWLSGSFVMVDRAAFDAIGGFDEGYFMYFEDVDLGYRLGKKGLKSVLVPSASVMHTGAHSTTNDSARMIQVHHDSAYRYLSKKYSAGWLAPLRWTLRSGLSVRAWYLTRRIPKVPADQDNNAAR
ncbi:glycosyltransferase family 2 protein [Leifsonia shinshuensis]|uniref:glycosyltransferase n=1 Tax=Leifsonia shinshuensis TaxID=150026 RepID=UPI001F50C2D5|nr:glycosyltransferase family 2 protein [Leifsonia shinshuensis]MCI0158196.1 glycosyltransferase family 2 protein [Leifsonia shinshuensis]